MLRIGRTDEYCSDISSVVRVSMGYVVGSIMASLRSKRENKMAWVLTIIWAILVIVTLPLTLLHGDVLTRWLRQVYARFADRADRNG